MTNPPQKWCDAASRLLILVPLVSLGLSLISWLRYGIDLPFLDDWRALARGAALSLNVRDLFTPSNDTLYPVGMALDALAQRHLSGNSIAYQFLSMTGLLGLLLWLQWRLLSSVLENRLLAAAAFSLTVFMLQPGSYWGLQNLAYHQGLPVLFLVAAIAVILDRRWVVWWGVPAVAVLGLLSGFSYISGALCALVAAVSLLGFAFLSKTPYRRALLQGGAALLAASCVTVAAQVWVIIAVQRGKIHDPTASWALPIDADFWLFMLGKVARSLVLPHTSPVLSLVMVGGAILVTFGLAAWFLLHLARGDFATRPNDAKAGIVFVTLLLSILAYLALLSAGRANLRPATVSEPLQIFAFGFLNYYHFFWATLLWPWVAAALFVAAKDWPWGRFLRSPAFAFVLSLMALPYAVASGAFNHSGYFRDLQFWRMNTQVGCLQAALDRGEGITCSALYPADLATPFAYGLGIGSSYGRYFSLKSASMGLDHPPPLFRLSQSAPGSVTYLNIASSKQTPDGIEFDTQPDPGLVVTLPTGSLQRCLDLEVSMLVKAQAADTAQVFFLRSGQTKFTARASVTQPVPGSPTEFAQVRFQVQSLTGFEDRMRIDPVAQEQDVGLKDLEVRCRLARQ